MTYGSWHITLGAVVAPGRCLPGAPTDPDLRSNKPSLNRSNPYSLVCHEQTVMIEERILADVLS
jgi:hypothetical protein